MKNDIAKKICEFYEFAEVTIMLCTYQKIKRISWR